MYGKEFADRDDGNDVLNSCGSVLITWFYLVYVRIQMQRHSPQTWGEMDDCSKWTEIHFCEKDINNENAFYIWIFKSRIKIKLIKECLWEM